ncbi:MAG TPA: glycosyl hydrolase family 18 protein, partial [Myxococcota bacterium]|nr:glycosyl hydrolase family 18 protein [Myxococcota bacterium]
PYWGDDPTGLNFDDLTHLAIFAVELNSDGSLSSKSRWTNVAGTVVPLAHAHGVKVHLCVISFDDAVHAAFLPSASRRATAIAALKQLVDDYGADGVNVDIEGLDADLRGDMVSFLQELDAAVGDVVVATPAIDWSDAFDEAAMSQLSGGMFIMGYGYHWTGGDPGPNDPLFGGDPWSSYSLEKTVQSYLSAGADPAKIILGLPLYGQEWEMSNPGQVPGDSTGDAWSVVMDEAIAIANDEGRSFDAVTRSPYVIRSDSQLWYPDNDSVEERIQWAVYDATLQGVGFWALTYEGNDPTFWPMVHDNTTLTPPDDTGVTDDTGGGDDSGPASGDLPVARAGKPIVASVGDTVFLNGNGSADPNG